MNQEVAPGLGLSVPSADGSADSGEPQAPQARFDALVDEMMKFRPSRGVNYAPFRFSNLSPQELLADLNSAVPEGLLISDGMEMPRPILDATVRLADSSRVTGVALVAHRYREHGGVRRFLVLEFSSRYPDGIRAMQKMQLESDSRKLGELQYHGVALVDPNAETGGYHRTSEVKAADEQAVAFIFKAKGLFEAWQRENPERVAKITSINQQAPAPTTS